MKVFTDYLWFNTKKRQEFVRITDEVAAIVKKSGVRDGMVLVSAMHITAGVYVNDWENGLIQDFQVWLEKLAPAGLPYQHHQTGEDNADAHLKRTIMGHQVMLPVTDGAARSRAVGAGVLRRVRRPAEEARRRESDRRVTDHFERVRALFDAVNAGDAGAIESLYHADAVAEHLLFDVDASERSVGRASVVEAWQRYLTRYRGALAGGRRFQVCTIAGIETGGAGCKPSGSRVPRTWRPASGFRSPATVTFSSRMGRFAGTAMSARVHSTSAARCGGLCDDAKGVSLASDGRRWRGYPH